jgi:hypothetical protein
MFLHDSHKLGVIVSAQDQRPLNDCPSRVRISAMHDNPYRAPVEDRELVAHTASRRARLVQLALAAFAGAITGIIILSPFIRGPRGPVDPTGGQACWHGAAYGGLVGLAVEVLYLLMKDYGDN